MALKKSLIIRDEHVKPLKAEYLVKLKVVFQNTIHADIVSLTPKAERINALTVSHVANDIIEA